MADKADVVIIGGGMARLWGKGFISTAATGLLERG